MIEKKVLLTIELYCVCIMKMEKKKYASGWTLVSHDYINLTILLTLPLEFILFIL